MGRDDVRVETDGVGITITESAGADGAVVVFVDTEFEPDGSDGGRGLRVLINDGLVYTGVSYEPDGTVIG